MFVVPPGDAPSLGVSCSVYKSEVLSELRALGKKQVSLRHKRTKATQQDLSNHILLYKTNGIDYVPPLLDPRNGLNWFLFIKLRFQKKTSYGSIV